MIIAVDFDGTLHDGEYPKIGAPMKNAVEVMRKLHSEGHTIIIWTCRTGWSLFSMAIWLKRYGIPFDHVNEPAEANLREYGNDTRKVFADVYIDDHNIGGIPSWRRIYRIIGRMKKRPQKAQ